jgi:hypothetical protein
MYVKKETDTERSLAVELVLEDIPGGGTVDPDDFQTATDTMLEGSIVGEDSNGLFHLVKTAELYENEADTETAYKVLKNHEFVVGDFMMFSGITGSAAEAITEIDTTTSEDYDILTVGTTLGLALTAGQCLVQATAQAASGNGAYKYTAAGVSRNSVDLTLDNLGCGIVMRGRVRVSQMPYSVDAAVKALLPLINFV